MRVNCNYALRVFFSFYLIFVCGCARSQKLDDPNSGFIQIKGSDTLLNAVQMLAEEFMKNNPYIYTAITGGGSGVGIASLINKTCSIADASRKIKKKEIDMAEKNGIIPKEFVIAYDGIALIVNKDNPIDKLTIEQLHDIYTGRIKNWKEVGGKDLKITVLSREVNSGTHVYFKEEVVQLGDTKNKQEFADNVLLLSSSQAIVDETAQNSTAIGYFGMGYISDKIKTLLLSKDGKEYYFPDIKNVLAKKYPLSRELYMYTGDKFSSIIKKFMDFVFSSQGQKCIKEAGFVPLRDDA